MTVNRIVGVVIGIIGVVVLRGIEEPLESAQTLGIGLGLAGTLCFGFAALWGRRRLKGVAPLKSATCQLICSSVIMLIVVGMFERPGSLDPPSMDVWFALFGLTLFGTAFAYIVYFQILVRAGPSTVMLVTLLIPITALFLGNMLLDEVLRTKEIIGALIIGTGLLFINGRIPKVIKQNLST
ncbi:MAG: DMT family transporter [Pseudomonadota bacterium]|nr:DMT family transporter [Pseudomonadota bacterium]